MLWFAVLLAFSLSSLTGRFTSPAEAVEYVRFNKTANLTTILVSHWGDVFVGGVDNLWQLNRELDELAHVPQGPVNDSTSCGPPPTRNCSSTGATTFKLTHNTILALVQGVRDREIIACGTIYMGACQTLDLDGRDISASAGRYEPQYPSPGRGVLRTDMQNVRQTRPLVAGGRFILATSQLRDDATIRPAILTFNIATFTPSSAYARISPTGSQKAFPAQWTAVFAHGRFAYFLYNTKEEVAKRTTTLARLCEEDIGEKWKFGQYEGYGTFVQREIELAITDASTPSTVFSQAAAVIVPGSALAGQSYLSAQETLLFIAFDITSSTTDMLAGVGVMRMKTIEDDFHKGELFCKSNRNASVTAAKHLATGPLPCTPVKFQGSSSFCNIKAHWPIQVNKMILEHNNFILGLASSIRSMAATVIDDHTVLLLGTNQGQILKVVVRSFAYNSGEMFDELTISHIPQPITQLELSKDKEFAYALMEYSPTTARSMVVLVPVGGCERYTTCNECTKAHTIRGKQVANPLCGWCTYTGKCTTNTKCDRSTLHRAPRPWFQDKGLCPAITDVLPRTIPLQVTSKITLTVHNVPEVPGQSYKCSFGSDHQMDLVRVNSTIYECNTPQFSPTGKELSMVDIGLYLEATKTTFVSFSSLEVFDCTIHKTCSSCLASGEVPCGWCTFKNKCTFRSSDCRSTAAWMNVTSSSSQCAATIREVLVQPAGVRHSKNFVITGRNLVVPTDTDKYACEFQTAAGSPYKTVGGKFDNSGSSLKVTCDQFYYPENDIGSSGKVELRLILKWNSFGISGAQESIKVTFYSCPKLARGDCSLCIAQRMLPKIGQFLCSWCEARKQCEIDPTCSNEASYCPAPKINSVYPQSGPIQGGTIITINGTNLGTEKNVTRVFVGHVPCQVKEYETAQSLTCDTQPISSTSGTPMDVVVHVLSKSQTKRSNPLRFTYTVPVLKDISPQHGPAAGGTLLELAGSHLDTGSSVNITVAGIPCNMATRSCPARLSVPCRDETSRQRNSTTIWCYTGAHSSFSGNQQQGYLQLSIDGATLATNQFPFAYKPNPTFNTSNILVPPTGIKSGGTTVYIRGNGLDAARRNHIVLNSKCSKCSVENATALRCVLPPSPLGEVNASVWYDCNKGDIQAKLTVFDNPRFKETTRQVVAQILALEGENLDRVPSSDYKVFIGDKRSICVVTLVNKDSLICRLPTPNSDTSVNPEGGNLKVTVMIGENIEYKIGVITYQNPVNEGNQAVIAGAAAGGPAFLVLVFLLSCLIYRKKSVTKEKQIQDLVQRFENLESGVARECKEAFTDLMTDLGDHGIGHSQDSLPFLPFDTYAMRSLFPHAREDHPILLPLERRLKHLGPERVHHTQHTLGLFKRNLLHNKVFMLTFIQALEKQFNMRDRVTFASLIMVAMHNDMTYLTEILKCLLADLIHTSIRKGNPKLLLRRMESIAEKLLSNWLTFVLYDYIRNVIGQPLYMLYQGIKTQVERGPIDAVYGDARYSLSEERLLREMVEYKVLNCVIEVHDGTSHSVRLLDCDTISQAKEKVLDAVYKTGGVSSRPDLQSVDLSYQDPDGSRLLVLRDEDQRTIVESGWKQVNTLGHYKVKSGARFSLVQRKQLAGTTDAVDHVSMLAFSSNVTNFGVEDDDGVHLWHLSKHSDFELERQTDKIVSEVYLTRMLFTKSVLQPFTNDLFMTIFASGRSGLTPAGVKYLFDFLDQQAFEMGIDDPEVVLTWKNNSVPLRFWVNVIKNPDFVFDIHKSTTVDACLSVIAQMFMDSCSTTELRYSKDTPTTKLLFAKEVKQYREAVEKYYGDVQAMPTILESHMSDMLIQASTAHRDSCFQVESAMYDIFYYAVRHSDAISAALQHENQPTLIKTFDDLLHMMERGFQEHTTSV